MPRSALNPAPTLADLQRSQTNPTPPAAPTQQHPAFGASALRRRRASHSSHGSDSSHSSHSSYARRHPDRVPQKAASPNAAFLSVLGLLAVVLAYTLAGLWLFVKGFLLTRHELARVNECAKPADPHWTLPSPPPINSGDAELLTWAQTALDPTNGQGECKLQPTHSKVVLLIIDALRYDFVAPPPPAEEEGWKPNAFYHNVLSLPAQLTAQYGTPAQASERGPASFLAHFAADPPTTTLQRLKGLTTGTLPTFVEAGANFGSAGTGVGRVNEDNWLAQFRRSLGGGDRAGLVFAGDDTWSTVFPGLFDNDTTWSYDSFNVEDLDTVDRAVESKLLPFLQLDHPERQPGVHDSWRLLVGHTLGVDHVGHRFGPSHPKMTTKLTEMQELLRNVTEAVDDETLVVLLGDHGMDERGDHGGDAELEVGAGIWIYSKGGFGHVGRDKKLRLDPAEYVSTPEVEALLPSRIPFSPLPSPPYPAEGHRSIAQIDLVPTLSVLLGLPIPYNNLGSIIPDLFSHPDTLLRALRITATQMHTYLDTYARHAPDLAKVSPELDALWLDAVRADARVAALLHGAGGKMEEVEAAWRSAAQAYHRFNRVSLVRAREVWAQFDMVRIALGLTVLALALGVAWVARYGAQNGLVGVFVSFDDTEEVRREYEHVRRSNTAAELYSVVHRRIANPALFGAVGGVVLHYSAALLLPSHTLTLLDTVLAAASITSALSLLAAHFPASLHRAGKEGGKTEEDTPASTRLLDRLGWTVLAVHAGLFASNSWLVFEDRFVLLALGTLLMIRGLLLAGAAPTTNTKIRAALLTLLALVLVRLAAIPRVCREEQMPHCTSTFFAPSPSSSAGGSAGALNRPSTMALAYALAYLLPGVLARFLSQSKSLVGIAPAFFKWVVRPTLMLGAGYWALDWAVPLESVVASGWAARLEWLKLWVAKADMLVLCIPALAFWVFAPLCLEIRRETVPNPASEQGADGAEGAKEKVSILGYANSFGSSYLLLVALVTSVVWLVTQPSGQLALGAVVVAGLVSVELGDAERDVLVLHRQRMALAQSQQRLDGMPESQRKRNRPATGAASSPSAGTDAAADGADADVGGAGRRAVVHLSSCEVATFALLGQHVFFGTGHQATLSSIQWRTAFLFSPVVTYPLSPLLVALNAFGGACLLPALLVTLAVLWNTTPLPRGSARKMPLPRQLLSALATLALYHTVLLLSTAALATVFKRHLMLFKIWTPRFMLAATASVLSQLAALGAATAAWHVANKVGTIFGSEFA